MRSMLSCGTARMTTSCFFVSSEEHIVVLAARSPKVVAMIEHRLLNGFISGDRRKVNVESREVSLRLVEAPGACRVASDLKEILLGVILKRAVNHLRRCPRRRV